MVKTRLARAERLLARLAPAEPITIRFVWEDAATGERELASELVTDGRAPRVIYLAWPEDEGDEKQARQDAPGRA